jgi:FKBP-type peptidyl-prolyl cis-trans isomerase FklB
LKQPLQAFNLTGVVAGWQEGFPLMKKGGIYKLYLPFHLAYGEEGMFNQQTQSYQIQPFESLVFYIELIDYGKAGSLTKK